MRAGDYWQMLRRHGFRVDGLRMPMALVVGQMTPWNSLMHSAQNALYGRKIRDTLVKQPPVFIIGHWRSGTTHLHELMIRDQQFGYATTYQCFAPWHFLFSESFLAGIMGLLVPSKRPMDNMATGMQRPQEDEFGLAVMGAPTMYYRMGFPKDPVEYLDTLNMQSVPAEVRKRFMKAIGYFYKALTVKHGKRLLLKSPPHTGRVELLSRMYPGAKFVHISRSPYEVFPSMQRTWQALYDAQGFQLRKEYGPEFDEYVHTCYEKMYQSYDQQIEPLAEDAYCEIRYDDLAAQPVATVQSIYQQLNLPGFTAMRPALEQYVASLKGYQPNRLTLSAEVQAEINDRWAWYFERFGYPKA